MGLLRIDQIAAATGDQKAERIANEIDHRDKKSDGYLDDKELSIFMRKAGKEGVSDEVINKIYSLANGSTGNVSEEGKETVENKQDKSVAEQPTAQAVTNPAKEDRTSRADRRADVAILQQAIKADGATLDNIADKVVGSEQTKKELKESIDYLKGVMTSTKNHDQAVAKIGNEKKGNARYYIQLLNELEKLEEKENVGKALELQRAEAKEAQGEDKVMDRADIKAGKQAVKETGDYTGSEIRQANRQLKDEVKAEARNIYAGYVAKVINKPADETGDIAQDKKLTREDYIHRRAVEMMKADGVWNELVQKGVNEGMLKEFWSGDDSFRTMVTEVQAAKNDVEQSMIQTDAETGKRTSNKIKSQLEKTLDGVEVAKRDALGNPTDEKIKLLEIKDGKWNFEGLSQEIRNILGADFELNKDAKVQENTSEFKNIKTFLESKMGTLTNAEVKEIVKLCGFDVEEEVKWQDVVKEVVTLGAAGAGGGAATTENVLFVLPDTPLNTTVTVMVGGEKKVISTVKDLLDGGILHFVGDLGTNAALGAVLPALAGVIDGATKDKTQASTISLAFNVNNYKDENGKVSYEKYVAELKASGNPYAQAAEIIAGCFVQDGEWDYISYRELLNSAAGDENDILNPKELMTTSNDVEAGKISFETEAPKKDLKVYVAEKPAVEEQGYSVDKFEAVPVVDARHSSWAKISEMYPCLDELGYSYADKIRIMKIVQAINNGDYSKENIDKLLAQSKQGYRAMQGIDGLDYDTYEKVYKASIIGDIKIPNEIAGCKRVTDTPEKAKIAQGGTTVGKYFPDRVKVGSDWVQTVPGRNAVYAIRVDGESYQLCTDKADQDSKFANIRANNPGRNVEKVEISYEKITSDDYNK